MFELFVLKGVLCDLFLVYGEVVVDVCLLFAELGE